MPFDRFWRWVRRRQLIGALAVGVVVVVVALGLNAQPDTQQAAGAMTVANRTSASFEQPAGGLSATELARRIGITPEAVCQWKGRVPVNRVIAVEAATGVLREHLRPDVFAVPRPAQRRAP